MVGLAAGGLAHWLGDPMLLAAADVLEPIGNLWTGAMRLLAAPMVVALLVTSVAGLAGGRAIGRLGAISLAVFAAMLVGGAMLSVISTPAALNRLPLERLVMPAANADGIAAALPGTAAAPATPPDFLSSFRSFDPIESIGQGEILPLVVLAVVFAIAVAHIGEEPRRIVVVLFEAVGQALFVILSWLLLIAPAGVFALTYSMSARHGSGAAGILGASVAITIAMLIIMTIAMYPAAVIIGRVPGALFARAVAPAQLVAVSTRSSLASLPALVQGGERVGLAAPVAGFVLPISVAAFRPSKAVSSTVKLFVVAHMYGIELSAGTIATFVITILLTSFGTPGVPSNTSIQSLPPLLAAGLPLEGIVMVNAVDALPDIFKTLLNVTANLSAATIVARLAGYGRSEASMLAAAGTAP